MLFNPKFADRQYSRYFVDLRRLYQKKETMVYTGITLSLLTVAFFGLFALKPTLVTIASLVKEIQNKKQIDHQLQTKINNLALAQKNFASAANSLTLVEDALPADNSLAQFLSQLEILIQQEGLSVRSLSLEPINLIGEITPGLNSLNFSLALAGDFENLTKFLSTLEKLRRIVIFDSLTITPVKSETEKTLSLNLAGKVYFLAKEKK